MCKYDESFDTMATVSTGNTDSHRNGEVRIEDGQYILRLANCTLYIFQSQQWISVRNEDKLIHGFLYEKCKRINSAFIHQRQLMMTCCCFRPILLITHFNCGHSAILQGVGLALKGWPCLHVYNRCKRRRGLDLVSLEANKVVAHEPRQGLVNHALHNPTH